MSEIKLLPCPICDKEVYIGTEDYYDHIEKVIVCDSCNLRFYGSYGTEEDLIKEWNTRKPMERIIDRLEEEKDYMEVYPFSGAKCPDEIEIVKLYKAKQIVKEEGGIE